MSNFWVRTIWGTVYATVVILALMQGFLAQWTLVWVISTFCIKELLALKKIDSAFNLTFGWVLNTLILLIHPGIPEALGLVHVQDYFTMPMIGQTMLLLVVYFAIQLFRKGITLFEETGTMVFALVYISVPSLLFLHTSGYQAGHPYNWQLPMLVFILTWSSDTFAYLTGRAFGKIKLYEALSPKKTIEGFIGGTVLTAVVAAVLGNFWNYGIWQGALLGAMVSVAGTAGDLFESALKRQADIKDSGRFIPGHGGALDRFDAFLFVSVVVYSWSLFK